MRKDGQIRGSNPLILGWKFRATPDDACILLSVIFSVDFSLSVLKRKQLNDVNIPLTLCENLYLNFCWRLVEF